MIRLKDIRMQPKLIGLMLLVSIIPLSLVAYWASNSASEALVKQSYGQLTSLRAAKSFQLDSYFSKLKKDMSVLGETVSTIRKDAFEKLEAIELLKMNALQEFLEEYGHNIKIMSESNGAKLSGFCMSFFPL